MDVHLNQRPVIVWLFAGCFLIFSMVILGGITRLTGSGLSITEWDVIIGAVPPLNEQDWNIAFDKYKQSPQYQKVNIGMNVEEFKSIFFWEYFHRLVGRLLGVVFIIPFIYFLFRKVLSRPLIGKLLIILSLGALQGFLGWYMVASGLVDRPSVSHYRLAMHLITAFITFGYTFWVALDLIYHQRNETVIQFPKSYKTWSLIIMITLIIQIIYGAFMAGLHGGSYYNTFPKMGNEWFPSLILFLSPKWLNFFDNPVGVQFVHRYIGTLLVVFGGIILFIYRRHPLKQLSAPVWIFISALAVQFTLGLLTLLYAAPITLAAFHQIGGFFLFGSTVFLLHRSWKAFA